MVGFWVGVFRVDDIKEEFSFGVGVGDRGVFRVRVEARVLVEFVRDMCGYFFR